MALPATPPAIPTEVPPGPTLPGLRFEVQAPATEVSPLRTDIAGFVGPTLRGPLGVAVRVEGWRQYQALYGDFAPGAETPYGIRGYFENGGEVAYVIRLLSQAETQEPAAAWALWQVAGVDPVTKDWVAGAPSAGRFTGASYRVEATSPGVWANGMRVTFRYRMRGRGGKPEVDIDVLPLRGDAEYLMALPPDDLVAAVEARSALIRLSVVDAAPQQAALPGPLTLGWDPVILDRGTEVPAGYQDYIAAADLLAGQREVALMAAPDLWRMPGSAEQQQAVLGYLLNLAEASHDRQLLSDLPAELTRAEDAISWLDARRIGLDEDLPRSMAVYHPRLLVPDPLGGVLRPLREVSPLGHVAGVVSRLDRERGAHHTPANAELFEAVDLAVFYKAEEQGALAMAGINPLRCASGRGLVVWGGRTAFDPDNGMTGLFVAHRRLIHRLVRAIRRVAEPLVFENNGPDLWLTLVRAITSVLLEAWQAGALKGEIPEQAFQVHCDETTTPPETEDAGQLLCEVMLAPAVPMEFITLRIAASRAGQLEVIEA